MSVECQHGSDGRSYIGVNAQSSLYQILPFECAAETSHLAAPSSGEQVEYGLCPVALGGRLMFHLSCVVLIGVQRFIRPELIQEWKQAGMPRLSGSRATGGHKGLTRYLVTRVIPMWASELDAQSHSEYGSDELLSCPVKFFAHARGVNLRHLGLLRSLLRANDKARTLLLLEMVSRTIRRVVHGWWRVVSGSVTAMRECTAVALNLMCGTHKKSERFWAQIVLPGLLKHYGRCALSVREQDGFVWHARLLAPEALVRVVELLHIKLSDSCTDMCSTTELEQWVFSSGDVTDIETGVNVR